MDLTKLKVKLTLKDAFLASIAYQLNLIEDPEIETAETNGFDIKFNPEYMDNLTLDEQLSVLAHECMHVALQHTVRFNNIEKGNRHTYNVAGDMLINSWLSKHEFTIPSEWVQGDKAYLSSCTEEMYRQLLQENNDPSQGSSMNDDIQENLGGGNGNSNQNQNIEDFTRTVLMKASASTNSTNAGSLNEIQRAFQELVKPKLPWFKLLRNYVNDFFPDDYSWKKPNRRFMEIAYLPSICDGEALRNINVYIDVSGSVSDETLSKYLSEVKKIFTDFEIQTLRLNLFSDGIVKTEVMNGTWSDIDKDFISGGTTISEVIEDINKYKAVVSLVITDGYFYDHPNQEAKYPVIWCITDHPDFTYPFGKVIDMDTY